MRDLTTGSITTHIGVMAGPIAATIFTQMALQLVSLYFVTQLGAAATAGVNLAGTILFGVAGLTQTLDAGTAALVAHAAGRKDAPEAKRTFNQALGLASVSAAVTVTLLYAFGGSYLQFAASDGAIVEAGTRYIYWAAAGFAFLFPWSVLAAGLRGTGIVRPTTVINMLTVLLHAALTPMLIEGWGPIPTMGAGGAGLAFSLSNALGVVALAGYFRRVERFIGIEKALIRPQPARWRQILIIGLPVGAEFLLTFLATAVVYYAIRDFGASAQAGYGIGSRVLQTMLAPALAIAFAAGPVAGQNFGASNDKRVLETFILATLLVTASMLALALLCYWQPLTFVQFFATDTATIMVAAGFLQLRAWSFVTQGLVYTCSTMFQSLGNTMPALVSSGVRFIAFALTTLWLSRQAKFQIEHVWYVWVASVALQACVSLWLLAHEFRKRLRTSP